MRVLLPKPLILDADTIALKARRALAMEARRPGGANDYLNVLRHYGAYSAASVEAVEAAVLAALKNK